VPSDKLSCLKFKLRNFCTCSNFKNLLSSAALSLFFTFYSFYYTVVFWFFCYCVIYLFFNHGKWEQHCSRRFLPFYGRASTRWSLVSALL
jgi:hypothetical protein